VCLGPLEVGTLPKPTAGQITELVERSGFFDLAKQLPGQGTTIDYLEYRMVIENRERANQVSWTDNSSAPKELWELVQLLASLDGWHAVPWGDWHPLGA
jgi:hypothetical protein